MRKHLPATSSLKRPRQRGFSLVEIMVGSAIIGIFFVSFFAMTGMGFNMVRSSRENLRATQILLNRVEGVRLFNWDQLTDTNKLPTTFIENYDPNATNSNFGTVYSGTMTVSTPSMNPAATYSSNGVKQVTVQISWNSAGVNHTRSMSTYVSKYGAQNYVFSSSN